MDDRPQSVRIPAEGACAAAGRFRSDARMAASRNNSLVFQPASDGFHALPIIEGNLNLWPQHPQLRGPCEWFFSATRRKVPSRSSDPLIQATFRLIVVHGWPIKNSCPSTYKGGGKAGS